MATQQAQRRGMGTHAVKPEWTGIDKTVRSYLPEDYQLAGAILAAYGTLIFLSSIGGGSKAAEPEAAPAPAAAPVAGQGVPPVDSPEFEKYVADDAFVQLLENEDQLSAWVDEAK